MFPSVTLRANLSPTFRISPCHRGGEGMPGCLRRPPLPRIIIDLIPEYHGHCQASPPLKTPLTPFSQTFPTGTISQTVRLPLPTLDNWTPLRTIAIGIISQTATDPLSKPSPYSMILWSTTARVSQDQRDSLPEYHGHCQASHPPKAHLKALSATISNPLPIPSFTSSLKPFLPTPYRREPSPVTSQGKLTAKRQLRAQFSQGG